MLRKLSAHQWPPGQFAATYPLNPQINIYVHAQDKTHPWLSMRGLFLISTADGYYYGLYTSYKTGYSSPFAVAVVFAPSRRRKSRDGIQCEEVLTCSMSSASRREFVERKTTIPILGNILCEASGNQITLTATDLELSIRHLVRSQGEKRRAAGNHPREKKLLELVRLLPDGEISIQAAGKSLGANSGRSQDLQNGLEWRKIIFRRSPHFPASHRRKFPAKILSSLIARDGLCDIERRIALPR